MYYANCDYLKKKFVMAELQDCSAPMRFNVYHTSLLTHTSSATSQEVLGHILPCNLVSRCIQGSAAYKAYRINCHWFSCKSEWMEHKPNWLRNDTRLCRFCLILVSESIPGHFLSITTGRCTYLIIIKFSGR